LGGLESQRCQSQRGDQIENSRLDGEHRGSRWTDCKSQAGLEGNGGAFNATTRRSGASREITLRLESETTKLEKYNEDLASIATDLEGYIEFEKELDAWLEE
jgi:hypothetical protein